MDALPLRPLPSNKNLPTTTPLTTSFWWLCLLLLLSLPHIQCSQHDGTKNSPCDPQHPCNTGLKCILNVCSDGRVDAACQDNNDCLSWFQCVNKRCATKDESTEDGGEGSTESSETPEIQAESAPEEDPVDRTLADGIVEQCRTYRDCGVQHCLVQKDGRSLLCSDETQRCSSDKDCKALKGTVCQIKPDPTANGLPKLFCVFPRATSQPRKATGAPCSQNEDCLSNVCLTNYKECGGFCSGDDDCPTDFYCSEYSFFQSGQPLTFPGCYRRCQEGKDCPSGYTCAQEKCIPDGTPQIGGACQSSKNCPQQAQCLDAWNGGYCIQDCYESKSCPTGSACSPFQSGLSYCLKTCTNDGSCRDGYFCGSLSSSSQQVCLPRGDRELGNLCETDLDCQTGQCRILPTGRQCTRPCSPTNQCPFRFVCQTINSGSYCSKQCTASTDCPEDYICRDGSCTIPDDTTNRALGAACTKNEQCQAGLCITNEPQLPHGYCTQTCGTKKPCPSGSYCAKVGNQTVCLQTCRPPTSTCDPATGNCNSSVNVCRKGYYCSSQVVPVSPNNQPLACSDKNPCPKSTIPWVCDTHWQYRVCSLGLCLGRGVRDDGQTCFNHSDCSSGTCYLPTPSTNTPSCAADKDCAESSLGRRCETQQKRCVECLTSRDCPFPKQCVNNACTTGGYCVTSCRSEGESCSQTSQCKGLTNQQGITVGKYCLPTCISSLQCLEDFVCRPTRPNNVCQLR